MTLFPEYTIQRKAHISDCQKYRYWLRRTWNEALDGVCFIMLNPSTADAFKDDPTIRKCMGFAHKWGCGEITVVNLFAWRATDPKELRKESVPIGPENDANILAEAKGRRVIAAWGVDGGLRNRDKHVLDLLKPLHVECLGLTKDGFPRHPLYAPYAIKPVHFAWGEGVPA